MRLNLTSSNARDPAVKTGKNSPSLVVPGRRLRRGAVRVSAPLALVRLMQPRGRGRGQRRTLRPIG
jgi:hypothetical protein